MKADRRRTKQEATKQPAPRLRKLSIAQKGLPTLAQQWGLRVRPRFVSPPIPDIALANRDIARISEPTAPAIPEQRPPAFVEVHPASPSSAVFTLQSESPKPITDEEFDDDL